MVEAETAISTSVFIDNTIEESTKGKTNGKFWKKAKNSEKLEPKKEFEAELFEDGCKISYGKGKDEKYFFMRGKDYHANVFEAWGFKPQSDGKSSKTYRFGDVVVKVEPASLIEDEWRVYSVKKFGHNPMPEIRKSFAEKNICISRCYIPAENL